MQSKNPFCYLFFQCDLLEDFLEKLADEMRKHPIWRGTVFFTLMYEGCILVPSLSSVKFDEDTLHQGKPSSIPGPFPRHFDAYSFDDNNQSMSTFLSF